MHHHVLLWPFALLLLGFLIGSGRMACWAYGNANRWQRRMERTQRQAADRMPWGRCGHGHRASSGYRAFDEYRAETLRRLEEEQREFTAFLDRLRHAKGKAEFDQFMAERGHRSEGPGPQSQSL
jgi:hypothetical protein